jgi:CRISPR-associated protein Cst2
MHSLNNEGGEGNQIQTRMVNIVDGDGHLKNVNAISGDMIKHILAEHLHKIAVSNQLALCSACQTFNANRISADSEYIAQAEKLSDAEALTLMLQTCTVDDMLGNLITAGSKSLPRKSVVEFGWVIAQAERTRSDSYFHVKYASERSDEQRTADSEEGARKSNLGQAIFHRPANSGVYALVATIEAARIGFNDITQEYIIGDEERRERFKALLEALLYTLVEPGGAMRNTQAPHILDVRGVVTVSKDVVPAPTLSPLKDGYREEISGLCDTLNGIRPDALAAHSFNSLNEYAQHMSRLIAEGMPYRLSYSA